MTAWPTRGMEALQRRPPRSITRSAARSWSGPGSRGRTASRRARCRPTCRRRLPRRSPPGEAPTRRYPVLYFHGRPERLRRAHVVHRRRVGRGRGARGACHGGHGGDRGRGLEPRRRAHGRVQPVAHRRSTGATGRSPWAARAMPTSSGWSSTVKPIVDRSFPTRAEREATGIIGSSMGGLIASMRCSGSAPSLGWSAR